MRKYVFLKRSYVLDDARNRDGKALGTPTYTNYTDGRNVNVLFLCLY
jgi:hypothetical protein